MLNAGLVPREVFVSSVSAWKGTFAHLVGRDSADALYSGGGGGAE